LFYFFAKAANIKYKWVGMLGTFYVDFVAILFGWFLPVIFGDILAPIHFIWVNISDFQHSIFVIIPFFVLLFAGKRYFYAAVAGAYFHIFLDVFAHRSLPKLLFPFSNFPFALHVADDFNPLLVFGMNIVLVLMVIYFEWNGISKFINTWKYKLRHFKVFAILGILFFSAVCVVYVWRVARFELEFLIIFAIPLLTLNLMATGILFFRDAIKDENIRKLADKIRKYRKI